MVAGSQDSLVIHLTELILPAKDIAGGSMDNYLLACQEGHTQIQTVIRLHFIVHQTQQHGGYDKDVRY